VSTSDRTAPRQFLDGTPLYLRVVIWAGIVAWTVDRAPHHLPHRGATLAVMALAAVAIHFTADGPRRRRAFTVLLSTAAGLAAMCIAPNGIAEVPVFMAATRLPAAFSGRLLWTIVVVEVIATDTVLYIVTGGSGAVLLAGLGIPLLVQRAIAQQRLVAEHDRAQALLAELQVKRDAELQAAALQERGRIARDMHDLLAHSLAGLSLQLQAARAVAANEGVGPAVLEPLDKAAALARDGLAEAREAVGALREPGGLGLDAVPALVERHPGVVELAVVGDPGEVPDDVGHALYRMVQESLTNAARYAPGSPVRVLLEWEPARLCVQVDDDGAAPGRTPLAGQGTGLGLAGMQERLAGFGASLRSGPRPNGGWRVEATVALS